MHLRIFQAANSYHIHAAACECPAEPSEVGHPEGEAFATQHALFLYLWGPEILRRQVQADDLYLAADQYGNAYIGGVVKDITDLWMRTVFMPCTEGLPKVSRPDLEILMI